VLPSSSKRTAAAPSKPRSVPPTSREECRESPMVKLRRLNLGYKSLLDPHSWTLRNLYRWAFSFHLRICGYQAAGPVRNPEQPEFSPPRYGQSGVGRLLRQRSVGRFRRYRDSTGRHENEYPWPPCGIDRQPHRTRAQIPTSPRDWSPVCEVKLDQCGLPMLRPTALISVRE
jgi:hypothetical protein